MAELLAAISKIPSAMRGTMLWFNEAKDRGFILTDEGERLAVLGDGFADGMKPKGRCAQAPVSFEVAEREGVRSAEAVVFVAEGNPRRARRRHKGQGR
jgi:hypothetical protein